MLENESKSSATQDLLRQLLDDENLVSRPGIRVRWVSLSPSHTGEKNLPYDEIYKSFLEGFNFPVIEHIPLTPIETKALGLPPRVEPYKVTLYLIDYPPGYEQIQELYQSLVSQKAEQSRTSQEFYQALAMQYFPILTETEQANNYMRFKSQDPTVDSVWTSTKRSPRDILLKALQDHPQREIAIIHGHATTDERTPSILGDRLVGTEDPGKGNTDLDSYLINNLDFSAHAAIILHACASPTHLPSEQTKILDTPMFATQGLSIQRPIATEITPRATVTLHGQTLEFDWSEILRARQGSGRRVISPSSLFKAGDTVVG